MSPRSPAAPSLPTSLAAALGLVAALSGCASPAEPPMPLAEYSAALAPWQGQTEQALVSRWGPPQAVEDGGNGRWLVYVSSGEPAPRTTLSFGIGGFGFGGGHTSVGVGAGATVPVGGAPAGGCVTRFLVENGVVSRWEVQGNGCRRPR